jgi:uncharacterized protein
MPAISIFQDHQTFYAPAFKIRVNNNNLQEMVLRDVMQVTYKDKLDDLDSIELTVNNWDAGAFKPKYEPPSRKEFEGIFDPGKPIEVTLGYANNTKSDALMMKGEITTLEPVFPESGAMTLSVRALNVLGKFRKKQHTWGYDKNSLAGAGRSGIRDSEIARLIGQWKVSDQKPGLDVEIEIEGNAFQDEEEQPFVFQHNQYDIVFLIQRARLHGYNIFLDVNPKTKKDRLSFRRSESIRDVTYELAWGSSLCEFRPTLTTAQQVSKVKVMGWDRKAGKPIAGEAEWGKDCKLNRDQTTIAQAVEGREEVITDIPVVSKKDAEQKARGILCGKLFNMIKASGSTVGLPQLRSGSRVRISKLGPRFSGEYFVTETTHTIGDGGYKTNFSARREKASQGAAS